MTRRPNRAMPLAKRARTSTRRNLRCLRLPVQYKGNVAAVAASGNQHDIESPDTNARLVMAMQKQPRIDGYIHHNHHGSQSKLNVSGQSIRINCRQKIVLNEIALIACLTSTMSKTIFNRRQRTKPSACLDIETPCRSGNLKHENPTPLQRQHRTKGTKQDKRKVECQHAVGCQQTWHYGISAAFGSHSSIVLPCISGMELTFPEAAAKVRLCCPRGP